MRKKPTSNTLCVSRAIISVDSQLIKKYNVAGPRYTSYPTVPYWEGAPTVDAWVGAIKTALTESEAMNRGAAIYVHIPFCEQLCTFCGCNTRITKKHERGAPYIQAVIKELELYYKALNRTQPIPFSEMHLGGGTPTWLTAEELKTLIEGLFRYLKPTSHSELSFEADPRVTNHEQLVALHQLGFTRISFGIQDFDPKVQEIVNREQSIEQVEKLTKDARAIGYTSINYDLIYGLPLQTKDSVRKTIEVVRRLKPDRIAFYAYAHVPWIKPSQRKYTEADLPDGDAKRALYELGRSMLEEAGYVEIGMDHFALKTDALWKAVEQKTLHRNFMGYMPMDVHPMLSLGCSSIGDAWTMFAQNIKEVEAYEEAVNNGQIPIFKGHVLDAEDLILRKHILNLMTRMETDWSDTARYTDFLEEVNHRLAEPISDRLVEISGKTARITQSGRAYLRNICMAFDARLSRKSPNTSLFSKTI